MNPFRRNQATADMSEHGISLGTSVDHRLPLYGSFEDSILVLGPPRAGKSTSLIIPALCDAPGAAVTTSTRVDVLSATSTVRAKNGPVAVFDPQDLAHGKVPTLRWDPVAGCENVDVALRRATALTAGIDMSSSSGGNFWKDAAGALIRCLLHAAALDGSGLGQVLAWVRAPADTGAVRVLESSPDAAEGYASELAGIQHQPPQTSGSVYATAQRAFDCFASPRVLASCKPPAGEGFDPATFLADHGTMYVLGTPSQSNSIAPLLACIIQEIVEEAHILAEASPNGRLDPPLELLLDEAANIAPLPDLPRLLSTGGGSGIVTMIVLQSMSQAINRWSQAEADSMRDSSTIRLVLPGVNDLGTLRDMSALCGEIEIEQSSTSKGASGTSTSTHTQRVPRFPVDAIRGLPASHALLLHRRIAPVEVALSPWWERTYADEIKAALAGVSVAKDANGDTIQAPEPPAKGGRRRAKG